jgi:putative transposase
LSKRVMLAPKERQRLIKFGRPLGSAIKDLITIVSPATFARWLRQDESPATPRKTERKPGRPKTAVEIRELVLRLARETGWGYTCILGELKKLGAGSICRSTVVNILKEAGLDPCPKRAEQTWSEFLEAHAATIWQCDFFSHKVLTWTGWKECFLLVFLHVGTRRVFASPGTAYPNTAWVQEQATNFAHHLTAIGQIPSDTILFRDRDSKYAVPFDQTLRDAGVEVRRSPPQSPNLQAFIERWIQSIRVECLDKCIALGETHLNYLVREYVDHHHSERPHQSLGNRPPSEIDSPDPPILPFSDRVNCKRRLGGVLKHYHRAA